MIIDRISIQKFIWYLFFRTLIKTTSIGIKLFVFFSDFKIFEFFKIFLIFKNNKILNLYNHLLKYHIIIFNYLKLDYLRHFVSHFLFLNVFEGKNWIFNDYLIQVKITSKLLKKLVRFSQMRCVQRLPKPRFLHLSMSSYLIHEKKNFI